MNTRSTNSRSWCVARTLQGLHRDQDGTISILTVFAMLLLVMLLGMVMNVGRHADGKIRLQDAADGAAYSGGVVLARGMNTLSFTNHLLFDVFALTAFMREARDRNAEQFTPPVLAAWNQAGGVLAGSPVPRFQALGRAIQQKVVDEQRIVTTFSNWLAAVSAAVLPTVEKLLQEEAIPEFQRAAVATFPDLAQQAAMEVADRSGRPDRGRGKMLGALWRLDPNHVGVVGGADESTDPTLPAVDPTDTSNPSAGRYAAAAKQQRHRLAHRYLNDWNNESLGAFNYYHPASKYNTAWMSQFGTAWRGFTCGQLDRLLNEEYPESNLPHQIRSGPPSRTDLPACAEFLDNEYTFAGVTYWKEMKASSPKLFKNPTESDSTAFAQVRIFIPRPRLQWAYVGASGNAAIPIGGAPTDTFDPVSFDNQNPDGTGHWIVCREGVPTHWSLLNQHWTCQLVPATHPSLSQVLRTLPPVSEFDSAGIRLPNLGALDSSQMERINTH